METSTPRNNRFLQLVGEVALQPGGQILGSQVAGLSFTTLVSLLPGGADAALLTLVRRLPQLEHDVQLLGLR